MPVRKLSASTAGRKSLFVVRPTNRTNVAQGLFRWGRAQGCSSETPGGSKNDSVFCRHYLKKWRLKRQAINLALPRMVKDWGDRHLRLENASQGAPWLTANRTRTHRNRSVYWSPRPTQVCPSLPESSAYTPLLCEQVSPRINSVSIYDGGKVHYRVDRSP